MLRTDGALAPSLGCYFNGTTTFKNPSDFTTSPARSLFSRWRARRPSLRPSVPVCLKQAAFLHQNGRMQGERERRKGPLAADKYGDSGRGMSGLRALKIFSAETNFFHGFAACYSLRFLRECKCCLRAEKLRNPIMKTLLAQKGSHFS